MNKQKAILIVAALFATYPKVNEFHVTSDGQAFIQKTDAEAHSHFLNPKEPVVVSVTRDEAEAAKNDGKEEPTPTEVAQAKVNAAKKVFEKAETAFGKATAPKKADAETKMNEAKTALEVAEKELADLQA